MFRGAKKRTFRFGKKNVSFPKVETFRFADYSLAGIKYIFKEDGTYSYILKKRTVSGTYVFDDEAKTITMKNKLGIQTVAYVTVTGNSMSLVFNADKLMSILKVITGAASKVNSTAATLNSVAEAYDGLMLGFELKK